MLAVALLASVAPPSVIGCARRAPEVSTVARARPALTLVAQTSRTNVVLQAVSAVSARVAWVSGHGASVLRTTDGGATWEPLRVSGADSLEFRDVDAFGADTAYLLAAGPGERSRIYKTTDGGRNWTLQFTNRDPAAFLDCMAFWDAEHGIAASDAVRGRFVILVTADGGATWSRAGDDALPPALPDEGGFAASGTCVAVGAGGNAWFGMGNSSATRVLHTADRGRSWEALDTPLPSGGGVGIASVVARDARHIVVLGGPVTRNAERADEVALTGDGGRTWTRGGRLPFPGAVYGAAHAGSDPRAPLVAVGPGGMAASTDDGRSWISIDTVAYWSVGFARDGTGWAVGPSGRVVRIVSGAANQPGARAP